MIGDRLFVVDAERAARIQGRVNQSPVYFYVYSYRAAFSTSELLTYSTEDVGVCHADDVMFVLSPNEKWYKRYLDNDEDNQMCDMLLDMWIAFASSR